MVEGACLLSKCGFFPPWVRIPLSPPFLVPVAQLDRAIDCGSIGREFKSPRARQVCFMLKIKLEALKHEKTLHVEEFLDWKTLELNGEVYPYFERVKVKIDASYSNGRIIVNGNVRTGIIHPCDRCLVDVRVPIDGKVEALYLPRERMPKKLEKSVELTDLENVFYYDSRDEFIDLEERVIEAIVIEVPLKVLCKEDCKGLCPYCGINLNEHPDHKCKEADEGENSPFAILKKLK